MHETILLQTDFRLYVLVAFRERPMRKIASNHSLSYPIRLPDRAQEDALRLLDVSREVINATVMALWDHLDAFGERETTYAYKQVTALMDAPVFYGDRLWRCQAEQAGRLLRGQAKRKQQFALILPLLEQGMILPRTEYQRASKNRKAIKAALAALREEESDGGGAVQLQSLIEQACNFYLNNGCFPCCYEDMQGVPLLGAGILPYAGDDGGEHGQAYRFRIDLEGRCCYFAFRFPDAQGAWTRAWTEPQMRLALPDPVVERLQAGERLAPTLREIAEPGGTRYAVLDLNIEVPVAPLPDRKQVRRVLGWDS
jgi:putative transposase